MTVRYTNLAEQDIADIADFTEERFGPVQRELYLDALEKACEQTVPTFKAIAREVPERPDLRSWRHESHVIYFREDGDDLEIVRVLHMRQLPEKHL